MVTPVKIQAKIITDNTGIECELPILVTEHGPVDPLVEYLLLHRHDRSYGWSKRVVHATYLFIQYSEANRNCFFDPKLLFQSFVRCLYTGTVNDEGLDNSGLYWVGWSTKTANGLINSLTGLLDFIADKREVQNLNPLSNATTYEQRLNYAAWSRRNQTDFLGHIKDKTISETVYKIRNIRKQRTMLTVHDDAIAFPETLFSKFYFEGIGGAKDIRVATRNQLILLMMHFSGCRESDALHLWVHDVLPDPNNSESVIIHLHHPEAGKAPNNWRGRMGSTNRTAYLREKYALTPRNKLVGTQHVGWKYTVADHRDAYIQLYWFPQQAGVLFAKLWRKYIRFVLTVERNHPYAFVSFSPKYAGNPLTVKAFEDAYQQALYRIGKKPSKIDGLSTHGHRHAMGRRLEKAGVGPQIIKKVLHHKSLTSQEPYTAPGVDRVTKTLSRCYDALEHSAKNEKAVITDIGWDEITKFCSKSMI